MLRLLVFLATLATVSLAHAGIFVKTNNILALNLAGSWTNNAVPGSSDIAQWDNTVTAANTTNVLGANLSWSGLKILDPGATVTIGSGNTLTLGAGGIDMSAATQDLVLSNAVAIGNGSLEQWNVPNGRTLTVSTVPVKNQNGGTGGVQFNTTGTIICSNVTVALIQDLNGNPWATYGQSDWAAINNGLVGAASYTPVTTAFTAGVNNDIQGSFSSATVAVLSDRFNDTTPRTVTITGTHTVEGVLVTPSAAASGYAGAGAIRANRPSGGNGPVLEIFQNSPNDFTIGCSIANNNVTSHLVKNGPGNLIVSHATAFTGNTVVNGGALTVSATMALNATAISVNNNATLAFDTGIFLTNSSMTFAAGTTNGVNVKSANGQAGVYANWVFNPGGNTVRFSYANGVGFSTTTPPLFIGGNMAATNINIVVSSGNPTTGQFPLIGWTNVIPANVFASLNLTALPLRTFGYLSNNLTTSNIDLVITNVSEPLKWATGSGTWDIASSANWLDPLGTVTTYQQSAGLGDAVVFDDTASGSSPIDVNLTTAVSPASITANGSKSYTISGSGAINGIGGITKSGSGTLTLGTPNGFSGALNLNGGVVTFSALTNLGGGPINFNGGTLRYTNNNIDDISVRTVTFGASGATIDDGGNFVTLSNPIGNSGTGSFTKIGAGTLVVTGTNKYTGNTIVSGGTLMLGFSSYISNSPSLIVNATLDAGSFGTGLALNNQILSGTGTVIGNVTVPAGATISPATNGVTGTLNLSSDLTVSGGSLAFDVSNTGRDLLNVGGNLTINSGSVLVITNTTPLNNGVYKLIQYSGALLNGAGSSGNLIIQGFNQPGKIAALSDTTPNEIDLVVSTQGGASTTWLGNDFANPSAWDVETTANFANTAHTAVTFVQGDKPTFDDSSANPNVNLMAAVQPGSVTVNATNNSYTFQDGSGTGAGKLSGSGGITKNGPSTLTILTLNNNSGATIINGGTVQVGNGGQNGDIGTGNISNNGTLIFQQLDNRSVAGQITGSGGLTQQGAGTLTLAQDNSYSGATTISSGALQVGNGAAAGSLGANDVLDNGSLIFNRTGTVTVPNNISGSGAVSKLGASTMTFGGALTYTGNTFLSNGLVRLASANQIPDANSVPGSTGWLILDGSANQSGALDLNGFDETVNALSGLGGTFTGVITNSGTVATTTNVLTILGAAGTTYNGVIADNAAGAKTMLMLRGANELRLNGNNTYSGGTIVGDSATIGIGINASLGSGTLTMSNGTSFNMHNQGGSASFLTANIFIPDNATITNFSTQTGNGYAGVITGSATTTNIVMATAGQGVSFSPANLKQLQPFLGTFIVPAGQSLRWAGNPVANGGDFTTFDIEGAMNSKNAGTISLGALVGAGTINGPTAGTSTYIVGAKNIDSTFSGAINNTSAGINNALTKVGTGKLTLTGPLTYAGTTTVSNGVLAIASDSTSLDNSPTITLAGDAATIDVTGRSDTTLTLGNLTPQILNGHGIVNGNLFEAATSTNNLNAGVLRVTQTATINGALTIQINRTNAVNSAQLSAPTFVNGGSIVLTVTNVGSTNLAAGDKFQLFNQAFTGGFVVTNLPTLPAPQFYWTNNIAVDGSIAVASTVTVNTNITSVTMTTTGNVLTLSWPADHTGWTLQQQTNGVSGIWQDVAGSANINSTNIPIDPTIPSIFYRLKY